MADVGRLAGVSAATVSFVLNPDSGETITAETRARVLGAVDQLGYRPNRAARSLRTNRTQTIGFITDEVTWPAPAGRLLLGAQQAASRHESVILTMQSDRHVDHIATAIAELESRSVDAIVYAIIGTTKIKLPPLAGHVPFVLMNGITQSGDVPTLLPDETQGQRDATRLLLDAGHSRVAYLGGIKSGWATRQRLKGYKQALREADVEFDPTLVGFGNYRPDTGYQLASACLRAQHPPTAILCGNDLMAIGVYLAARERGLALPADLSIVGYDDHEHIAPHLTPALTTVRLPYFELGTQAVERLMDPSLTADVSRIPCTVIERESVAAR